MLKEDLRLICKQCSYRMSSIKGISCTRALSASQALMKIPVYRFKVEIIKIVPQAAYLQEDLQGL